MSTAEMSGPTSLAHALRLAREQHRAGAGAVLDILLRHPDHAGPELVRRLEREAGVLVLLDPGGCVLDAEARASLADGHSGYVLVRRGADRIVAMEDPWDEPTLRQLARHLGYQPMPAAATEAAMRQLREMGQAPAPAVSDASGRVPGSGPIVAFVDRALHAAHVGGASDVHFECDRQGVTAKLRSDGILIRFARLEGQLRAEEVISRIKVLAQLDITERRLPQDGRFRTDFGGAAVDVRVSIMPSIHGEDAVLRLLDRAQLPIQHGALSLNHLGFDEVTVRAIRGMAQRPSGMFLITGPTGSGKTTTVYAALSEINTGAEKLITIEDPVEYELPGVLQIPVNERKGLTFAKGLRSILRHDPDRILVGEIRDAETADIAVQSALTGHLVFTTVHANGLPDVIGRFRHFGLDMFGLMSSLNGVVVQRLLRRVCPSCATLRPPAAEEEAWLRRCGQGAGVQVAEARGCAGCGHTGYRGRFVVAETHRMDDEFRDRVTEGAPLSALKAYALARGVVPLGRAAARTVVDGRTTAEEVRRVVGWEEG